MSRIDSANPYRVQVTAISIADLAKTKPGMAYAASAAEIAELKLHEQQREAREAAGARYAAENPDQIYAQVVAGGKVVATVYDSGTTVTYQNVFGLKLSENGAGMALANARLDELMQAIPGQVIYANFTPPLTAPSSNMPESALPAVTARGLIDMMRDRHMGTDRSLTRSSSVLDDMLKA